MNCFWIQYVRITVISHQIVNKKFDWRDVTYRSFERFVVLIKFVLFWFIFLMYIIVFLTAVLELMISSLAFIVEVDNIFIETIFVCWQFMIDVTAMIIIISFIITDIVVITFIFSIFISFASITIVKIFTRIAIFDVMM